MILHADGILHDTNRRDTLLGGDGADTFLLHNDGKTDSILNFEDGVDRIDISSWDAGWMELTVRQLSLTDYVVEYQGEERLVIAFEPPAPEEIPPSGWLLDADDFIFRPGLPEPSVQVILEQSATEPEVLLGTTMPDVFVLDPDGQRDTIRRFEPGKDQVDLANYGTSFGALAIVEQKVGRVVVKVPAGEGYDRLVLIDANRQLTAEDIAADMFIF